LYPGARSHIDEIVSPTLRYLFEMPRPELERIAKELQLTSKKRLRKDELALLLLSHH